MTYQEYLLTALAAAKEAGKAILEVYDKKIEVEYKADESPLTLADKRSHEIIVKHLEAHAGTLPILSEEGKDIPYEERKQWEHFWLVDPLDGTKEFIKRNGEFTVNIAMICKDKPVLGVIYVPVQDVYYFGAEGIGAYRLNNSEALALLDETLPEDAISLTDQIISQSARLPIITLTDRPFTVVGSRSHSTDAAEQFVEKLRQRYEPVEFITAGSSLKFCLLAEGKADVYIRFSPTMEWDTAAGQAIVELSRGKVMNAENNRPLTYNKESLLNPWFTVTSPAKYKFIIRL